MAGIKIAAVITLFILVSISFGATIKGTVYDWYTLKPANGTIVTINTVPIQKFVAKNGNYEFDVPAGDYELRADKVEDGKITATISENVTVTSEGTFIIDLILFPDFSDDITFDENISVEEVIGEEANYNLYYIIGIAILVVLVSLYAFKNRLPLPPKTKNDIGEDLLPLLEFIKKERRIKQSDLRREMKFSEAKLSLMLTDLESQGLIKKVKKGRGNIIIYKG